MRVFLVWLLLLAAPQAWAQGANVAFGSGSYDSSLPVEVSADALSVDQSDGSAEFAGNVLAGQGEMRITAEKIRIEYAEDTETGRTEISRLLASGGVTLVNGAEAAEAQEAIYSLAAGTVEMTGDVMLTQGLSAISGDKLVVNLETGQGRMEGRVRTIIRTSDQ